jgi:hypothetical protein
MYQSVFSALNGLKETEPQSPPRDSNPRLSMHEVKVLTIRPASSSILIGQQVEYAKKFKYLPENQNPGRVKNFHFSISSRPALGSTQPPIKWVPGSLSWG